MACFFCVIRHFPLQFQHFGPKFPFQETDVPEGEWTAQQCRPFKLLQVPHLAHQLQRQAARVAHPRGVARRFCHGPLSAAFSGTEPINPQRIRRLQFQQPELRQPEHPEPKRNHHKQHLQQIRDVYFRNHCKRNRSC